MKQNNDTFYKIILRIESLFTYIYFIKSKLDKMYEQLYIIS